MLQAWALEQEGNSRRKFHEQDVLVPWQLQQHFSLKSESSESNSSPKEKEISSQVTYQRFCHVYCEGELEGLLSRIPEAKLIESGYDRSNWFILFEKC